MNKDIVYVEPEDDITDIIARLKKSEQKVVALVPPKKIGVLRSAVNTKLVAKAAREVNKVVVIVTTDSSLVKLAASAHIPVAKTLQSRPKLPSEIIEEEKDTGEQVIDEKDFDDETEVKPIASKQASAVASSEKVTAKKPEKKSADQEITSDDLEKDAEKKQKKPKKIGKFTIPDLDKYRKWIIIGAGAFVVLIVFLVWAIVFAPSAKISVAVRTTASNFAESVSFVTKSGDETPDSGKFLLESQKIENKASVEFKATGTKDVGEKATGKLTLSATINQHNDPISLPAGTTFSYGEYSYVINNATQITIDESDTSCSGAAYKGSGCKTSVSVSVTAKEAGDGYNIGSHDSGWTSSVSGFSIANSAAFSGGTSKVVTVVQQSDVDAAKEKLSSEGSSDGKSELKKLFGDDMIIIESSFEQSSSDPTASPAVGEEVKDGTTPKLEATTTYTMYAVDKSVVEKYIEKLTSDKLASDQKVYQIENPFFERFQKENDSYIAKLKATTQTGPKVTEQDIMEKSKGKKVGEVQSLIKSINGVSSVKVDTSFFWVKSVPNDENKITIDLKVEE